jgi:putative transcriptional regulator
MASLAGTPIGLWRQARSLAALIFLAAVLSTSLSAAESDEPTYLKGRLLVASTSMRDTSFAKTVIYMIEHDATGALGLVVNRSLGRVPLPDLFERLGLSSDGVTGSIQVHAGGPVEQGTIFILHSSEYLLEGSKEVAPNLALSNDPEILKAIGAGEGPEGYLFAFGYAGWAPGQLEGEIERGSWIDVPASGDLLFNLDDAGKWDRAVEAYSIEL